MNNYIKRRIKLLGKWLGVSVILMLLGSILTLFVFNVLLGFLLRYFLSEFPAEEDLNDFVYLMDSAFYLIILIPFIYLISKRMVIDYLKNGGPGSLSPYQAGFVLPVCIVIVSSGIIWLLNSLITGSFVMETPSMILVLTGIIAGLRAAKSGGS